MSNAWLDSFFPAITDLNKQIWFQATVYPALLFAYLYKYRKMGILYFFMCVLCVGLTDYTGNVFIKKTVNRARPFATEGVQAIQRSPAHGPSFISNHSANMFAFATYTSAFFPLVRPLVFLLALLIAFSRVYNGVHFPLDVLGGALWGVGFALLFIRLSKKSAQKLKSSQMRSSS